jgi:hypothetical protein
VNRTEEKYRAAVTLLDDAEQLVRMSEEALAAATGATEVDIYETKLREVLALQDQVAAAVAPAVEARRREIVQAVQEVARSARGEIGSEWWRKHRRFMSAATKSAVIRTYGPRAYRGLPW